MNHSIVVEKYGVRLRPVELGDSPFIVQVRNDPRAMGNIGDSASQVVAQEAWLRSYFARANDYYFIIENVRTGDPVGTWGVYNIIEGEGESGRWIVLPTSVAATASFWLAYHVCFDILRLTAVRLHVVETNTPVLAFHRRIGIQFGEHVKGGRQIGGVSVSVLGAKVTSAEWPAISERLCNYSSLAEKFL